MNPTEKKDGSENPFLVTGDSVRDLQKVPPKSSPRDSASIFAMSGLQCGVSHRQDVYYSRFDTVVGEDSTQTEVYDLGVKGLVDDVLNG